MKDINWCFNSQLIENILPILSVYTKYKGRIIARKIVYYFVDLAKKKKIEQTIRYVRDRPNEVETILFDLIMEQYVWFMGEANYNVSHSLTFFKAAWKTLVLDKTLSHKVMSDNFKTYSSHFYTKIVIKLNQLTYIVLSNLLQENLINENQYFKYIERYSIKTSHIYYEQLKAPSAHSTFANKILINIILYNNRDSIISYYKSKYAQYNMLRGGFSGDYPNYFYSKLSITPIGDNYIYFNDVS